RHWPIVLVGMLGKIFGPIGFAWTASRGAIPWHFGGTILTNDLLWWAPFGMILLAAHRRSAAEALKR
ncbi:MAG: alkyl hydroperoxide reductase, partial [Planctomycetota bacterium]